MLWKPETNARVKLAVMIPLLTGCVACAPKPFLTLPPAELAVCADEPLAPDLPPREQQAARDSLTLAYILAMRSAWGDCKSKVEGLRVWRETAGD